jgi:hypothetical protein
MPNLAAKLRAQQCDLFNDDGILMDDTIDTIGLYNEIVDYIYSSNDSAYNYNKLSILHTELMALCKHYNITTETCIAPNVLDNFVQSIKNIINKNMDDINKYNAMRTQYTIYGYKSQEDYKRCNDNYNKIKQLFTEKYSLYDKYNIPRDTVYMNIDNYIESIKKTLVEKTAYYYKSIQDIIRPKQECRPPFLEPLSPTVISPKYPESEPVTSDAPIISEKFAFEINLVPFDESIYNPIKKSTTTFMTCPHCEKLIYMNATT